MFEPDFLAQHKVWKVEQGVVSKEGQT